ncbi:CAP-Gly domain family protein [Acanthocheilonema viteae]
MATKVLNLTVTSDSRQYPYEKRYPASMTLHELKEKLVLVVGSSTECMQTELRDKDGKFISSLTDDQATLEKLGVIDASGKPIDYENVSAVEKYIIPEEKYNEREDSVRAWKRREGLKIKYDALASAENEAKQFNIGDRCVVHISNQEERKGVVSYIGLTKFKDGYWIGVTYDEPIGKHDGSVNGERYFTCENNHGVFVRPRDVKKCEQEEEMEEI